VIIADTSVWIDYFNGIDNELTQYLDSSLIEGSYVAVTRTFKPRLAKTFCTVSYLGFAPGENAL